MRLGNESQLQSLRGDQLYDFSQQSRRVPRILFEVIVHRWRLWRREMRLVAYP